MGRRTLRFGRINLRLDDTDEATPAMVCIGVGRHERTSTYDCACAEGVVDDHYELTTAELDWLDKQGDLVAATFDKARAGNPDYT